ncbi:hypothetical protein HALO32_01377 [Halomonas lysinitropha]|uniref:Uncharacterized protein n=1 Tax=Halomonas lysinitropha TaxID=2607506 RepID=A0A5K1I8G2_9GAMM|nr:hypothetical protein HALO32_01377 [Halomonas lysinitropha]
MPDSSHQSAYLSAQRQHLDECEQDIASLADILREGAWSYYNARLRPSGIGRAGSQILRPMQKDDLLRRESGQHQGVLLGQRLGGVEHPDVQRRPEIPH